MNKIFFKLAIILVIGFLLYFLPYLLSGRGVNRAIRRIIRRAIMLGGAGFVILGIYVFIISIQEDILFGIFFGLAFLVIGYLIFYSFREYWKWEDKKDEDYARRKSKI